MSKKIFVGETKNVLNPRGVYIKTQASSACDNKLGATPGHALSPAPKQARQCLTQDPHDWWCERLKQLCTRHRPRHAYPCNAATQKSQQHTCTYITPQAALAGHTQKYCRQALVASALEMQTEMPPALGT